MHIYPLPAAIILRLQQWIPEVLCPLLWATLRGHCGSVIGRHLKNGDWHAQNLSCVSGSQWLAFTGKWCHRERRLCHYVPHTCKWINTLRPRQGGWHFADDIFKCIFLNEDAWMSINISLKFVPKDQINNIPALSQIMAWRRPGDKPLSEPMLIVLLTHICVTQPQWVK